MSYLAVFDWNGTLFNDTEATHKATNASLAFFGLPPITIEEEQANFIFPLIHFYEKMGVDADTYLRHAEEVGRLFVETYERENVHCDLAEGAVELLEWLKEKDVPCKILSNHLQKHLWADVNRFGIAHYFEEISGNDKPGTIASGLSKQKRLAGYMEINGYTPEKTFIIGDSHEEPHVAKSLGLLGLSITGGLMNAERLAKAAPDHIVDRLDEVRAILEKVWFSAPSHAKTA